METEIEKTDANLDLSSSDNSANRANDDSSANKGEGIIINTSATKEKGFDPKSIAEQIKAKYNVDKKPEVDESLTLDKKDEKKEEKKEEIKDDKKEKTPEEIEAEKSLVLKSNQTPNAKDDSKLSFHNHPRFKQVIEERNKFEEEVKVFKQYEEPAKRMALVEKFCQENNVPPADYDESIRLAALVRSNPQEALTRFKAIVSALEIQTGSALPPDLQSQVDDGKLSLTHAQEMAKLRLDAAGNKHLAKQTSESAAKRAEQELVQSLDSWTAAKIKSDPSFKPKQKGDEDGKYELVTDKFLALWQQNPPKNVSDAVNLVEQAYSTIHNWIEKNLPKPQLKRPLSPKRNGQEELKVPDIRKPGWAKDVARHVMAGRGN